MKEEEGRRCFRSERAREREREREQERENEGSTYNKNILFFHDSDLRKNYSRAPGGLFLLFDEELFGTRVQTGDRIEREK